MGGDTGLARSRHLWASVCRTRGTPAPDAAHVLFFLANLQDEDRSRLELSLFACVNGRERADELEVISWAAACTRPAVLLKVHECGLHCAGVNLFSAGLSLMNAGWDMFQRIAQLKEAPADIESLRTVLALQPGHADLNTANDELSAGVDEGRMPAQSPHHDAQEEIDTPFEPGKSPTSEAELEPEGSPGATASADRVQLKLYGRESAHTLECGPHRRGADFFGVHVVTIESARALAGGGYDWGRKLVVQLTPEEMPAALGVLMGLKNAIKFAQHGSDRDKFVELRRQDGGIMIVTGQRSTIHAVPVRAATVYYLLDLFCKALAMGDARRSVADVLALARGIHAG